MILLYAIIFTLLFNLKYIIFLNRKIGIYMFKNKTKDEILHLFNGYNYSLISFKKNDIIALEYTPCNKIGLILFGSIDIKRTINSNNIVHITSLKSGNLFGEIIAFSDIKVYPSTVVASSNSEILFISKDDFINFCTHNSYFLNMFLNPLKVVV